MTPQPTAQHSKHSTAPHSTANHTPPAALAVVVLQVPSMLATTFSAIVHFVSRPQIPAIDCDARLANCLEGFLEVNGAGAGSGSGWGQRIPRGVWVGACVWLGMGWTWRGPLCCVA